MLPNRREPEMRFVHIFWNNTTPLPDGLIDGLEFCLIKRDAWLRFLGICKFTCSPHSLLGIIFHVALAWKLIHQILKTICV